MIIAQLNWINDPGRQALIGLPADPFPGDGIDLKSGSRVMVIRRSWIEIDIESPDPDKVDINLLVRPL